MSIIIGGNTYKPKGIKKIIINGDTYYQKSSVPTTWAEIQQAVRNGTAQNYFSVGDEFIVDYGNGTITLQVMGFDQETPVDTAKTHSMTLATKHDVDNLVYSSKEAFFYNGTGSVMSAGTYHFKMGNQDFYTSDVGKYIQFTLTQPLPVGGQLVWQQNYNATAIGANIKVYASGNTLDNAPTETVVMSEGQGGTHLGEIKNSFNTSGTYDVCLNISQRALRGNNSWGISSIRQWVNSPNDKNSDWVAKGHWDRPPAYFKSKNGFLYQLESGLVNVLGNCNKTTDKPVCEGGGIETTNDKAWLLSRYEIQSCTQTEAQTYPPYTYWHNLLGDTYYDYRKNTNFIKYNKSGVALYWFLRTPELVNEYRSRRVNGDGAVSYNASNGASSIVVAFAIV